MNNTAVLFYLTTMWNTVENSLQSCVSGKDAFPLCQMLTADSILFLKSLNAVDAASLFRNLKLIVAKKNTHSDRKGLWNWHVKL